MLPRSINPSASTSPGNPVFLTGIWRSGTSLLGSLLNQHPAIALMYECSMLDFPRPLETLRMRGDWLGRQEFFNQALSRHRLIYPGSLRGLEEVSTPDDLYRTYAALKGATHWGEKAPTYARRLRSLAERYPQSSIILIWRDLEDIVRSAREAGIWDPRFPRRGLLARVLGHHERMIADAALLERRGHRVLHVDYDAVVDETEETLRRICAFLQVEYCPQMVSLNGADFSSLHKSRIHENLLDGVIARKGGNSELPARLSAKIARFRNRGRRLRLLTEKGTEEPSAGELVWQRIAAGSWFAVDNGKRALFEFLPLAWLQSYRVLKTVFAVPGDRGVPLIRGDSFGQIATLVAAYGLIALQIVVKLAQPNILLLPLSMASCALLTLTFNRRWSMAAAVIAATTVPIAEWMGDLADTNAMVVAWNCVMRLAVLTAFVFLLDAARVKAASGRSSS